MVTPAIHQMHHSCELAQTNSNYGHAFSFWDRLFRTMGGGASAQPRPLTFGLEVFRASPDQVLHRLLLQPLLPRPMPRAERAATPS